MNADCGRRARAHRGAFSSPAFVVVREYKERPTAKRMVFSSPGARGRILVGGGVLLVLLLAAVFRGPLLDPLMVIVLRQTLGLHATVAQVGGTLATGLVVRGLDARGEAGAPLAAFAAERISARYSLASLLRGREAFLDSLEVTVDGARIVLDLTAPAAAGSNAAKPAGGSSLPRLPQLRVRNSLLRVVGPGYTLEADGLQGLVGRANRAQEQSVDLQAERFSLRHPSLREGTISLAIAGRYEPRRLSITAAQVNGEPLVERARLDFGERRGDFDLQLALRLWQGTIEFGMLRSPAGTEAHWNARGVDLQPQLLLVNPALGALRGRLSTGGEVRLGGGGVATLTGKLTLDWTGALLAGREVDHLILEGSAAPGVVLVERAEGLIGPNEIQLHQVSLPAAPLFEGRWRALLAGSSGAFTAGLGDVPAFLALWGVGAGTGSVAVPAHRLQLEGSLEKGRLQFARADLATRAGKATFAALTMSFPPEGQGWGETAFSGKATVDIPNLTDVSALFPVPPLSGSLRGEISGAGSFAHPEGGVSLRGRGVRVAGKTLGDVDLEARASGGRIEIPTLQVRQGGNHFTAQNVVFSPAALAAADLDAVLDSLSGSFALSAADLPALAALVGVSPELSARTPAKHLLTATGTVRGRALAIAAGSFAAAGGAVTLRAARVVLPPRTADWRMETTIGGELEVDLPDLGPLATIFDLPPLQGTLKGQARISGTRGAPGGRMEVSGRGISIRGRRVGDVVLKATAEPQRLKIETLEVTRGADRLLGRGAYDLRNKQVLEAEADIAIADVAPYLAEFVREGIPVAGRLHIGLRAAGPLPASPIAVEAEFTGGRIGSMREVRGILKARYAPGLLRLSAFDVAGTGGLAVKGEGTIPLDLTAEAIFGPGPLSLRAQASIPSLEELSFLVPPAYAVTGRLRADVVVTGSWKEPAARLEIQGERLQFPPGTRFAPPDPFTLAGTLTWGTAEARAEKVRLESPALSCSLSGAWFSPPSLPSLFADLGAAATGSLALRTSFSSPDVGWLRKSVAGLRGLYGSMAGEIAIDGPAGDPVLSGEIRIAGGEFRYKDLPPIDSLNARATVARRRVTLREFGGNIGGSPFTLAGSLDFSHPDDPDLDLRLLGTNVLLYRDEGLRVRADSDLTLRGPLSALSLTGELALTKSLYQKDITVASLFSREDKSARRPSPGLAGISFPEPPLRNMRFDVRLTAREPFEIRTTVVRGTARPDLRLTGTGLLPILSGPILVDTARVMLPSGNLEIERGTVLYREGDPDRPALDFGGRMQTLGYEITAQIGGTLATPEIILSSIPPLPKEELLLFALTGAPPGSWSAEGGSVSSLATPMALYLGKNVIGQILGGQSKSGKTALQDRIELQIGRELTRSGSVTVDARLLLQKNPIGRNSTLYVTSEKDIYDQYNAGMRILFKFK